MFWIDHPQSANFLFPTKINFRKIKNFKDIPHGDGDIAGDMKFMNLLIAEEKYEQLFGRGATGDGEISLVV